MTDDRRKNRRFETPGLKSNISDGSSAFVVVVDDVSKSGVGVSEVPAGFDETVHKCMAVVNAPLKDFELTLKPCWVDVTNKGRQKRIGFQIHNPSPEWIDFVEGMKGDTSAGGDQREGRRDTLGIMAIVSDGKSRYFGVVESISETGLRLTQIPADFDETAGSCTAVVNSPEGDVDVSLRPCWIKSTNKGMYKTVGFQIHNPPKGWQNLLEELKNENGQLSFLVLGDEDEEDLDE